MLGTWATLCVIGLVAWHVSTLPSLRDLRVPVRPPNLTILASDGTEIANRGQMGGARVRLADMPAHLPAAVLATEDRRFYSHFGLDVIGLTRAVILNAVEGKVGQGGSTLTQQLAKNLFLKPDRTMARKLREAMLALWLEAKFSKDEILEMYLNRAYFGAGAYGVEAAARRYFNMGVGDLELGQSALLAGLLKAPASLAPTRAPDKALERTRTVLVAMARGGVADPIGVRAAMAQPYSLSPPPTYGDASYAADWVQEEIESLLGGLDRDVVVETSLDLAMQAGAQAALETALLTEGREYGVGQGAIVVMANDGRVRAMVGGRDYAASQFNRAASARRQPGSAFKPIVWLQALQRGLGPETKAQDRPFSWRGWNPSNHGGTYRGELSLRRALAYSSNSVAARLIVDGGPKGTVDLARRLGITSELRAHPSLALGTSEVSLLELTGAYATLAGGGIKARPQLVTRVRTRAGEVLYERPPGGPRVVSRAHVRAMNRMMADVVAYGSGKRAALDRPVAGKTGTSQDYRDGWFVGYTAQLTAGVWFGNDDGTPSKEMTGGRLPAETWARVMADAHEGWRVRPLPGVGAAPPARATEPAPKRIAPTAPVQSVAVRREDGALTGFLQGLLGR